MSWTFEEKIALATAMCLDRRLTHADCRVAMAMLLYFQNSASGALFPSRRQVAEILDMRVKTVRRATENLKALGYLDYKRGSGGRSRHNNYVFKRGTFRAPFKAQKGDIWDPGRGTKGTHARGTNRTRALTPSNKPSATPSPSPRDRSASASPKSSDTAVLRKLLSRKPEGCMI
jgi:DNA-binding transcriptional MocR family regulator